MSEIGLVVFVVVDDMGYDGYSAPLAAFATRELAEIYIRGGQSDSSLEIFEMPVTTGAAKMTEAPETSETPSGYLRWNLSRRMPADHSSTMPVLQQLWYLTSYHGVEVSQVEEWRDVPVVIEE